MDQMIRYKCPKCGHSQCEIGEIWAAGTIFVKILGFENKRFTHVSCSMCHYTEIYRIPKKRIGEVINFVAR
jgi:predicted nucleic-acid-binding Zn-ribbon protein